MSLQFYAVWLCADCARGQAECSEAGCARWRAKATDTPLVPSAVTPMTMQQYLALEAGRDFERGLV